MHHRFKLSLIALAVTQPVLAQETPLYLGDDIVVTATRFPQPVSSTPSNVTVITAADIQASGARTLPEILATQAGIHARSIDGTEDMSIDLRGFGKAGDQNLVVLLDGERLNDNELTTVKWSAIPLDAIARIEIMRGAGAVLYGNGATGGVINIITKPAGKTPKGNVALSIGSYDAREAKASYETGGNAASLRLSGSHLETDNYRRNNQERNSNMLGDARYTIEGGSLFVKFGAEEQSLRLPSERVVSLSQGIDELASDRRGTSSPNDYSNYDTAFITAGGTHRMGTGELAFELGYRDKNQQADFVRFGSYVDGSSNALNANLRYRLPYRLGNAANTLVLGMDYADWDYGSKRSAGPSAPPTADVRATQRDHALYALHLTEIGATTISVGGRAAWSDQRAQDLLSSASYASGAQSTNARAYELGAKHAITPSATIFGKIGRSYRLPVVDEIYNQFGGPSWDSIVTLLKPQTSLDREVGIDFHAGAGTLRATAFRMEVTNELHYNALTYQNMNLSPTVHQGIELEGTLKFNEQLNGFFNYTLTESKFASGTYGGIDVSGKGIPLVPRHSANIGGVWRMTAQTRASATVSYVGEQIFDNDQDNTFGQKIPAYTTTDMKLIHDAGPWTWAFAVNNLFNEKYYTYGIRSRFTPGRYNAYPMPERNFTLSAAYHF